MFGRRIGGLNINLPTSQNNEDAVSANKFKKYRQICALLTGIFLFLLLAGLGLNRIYFSVFQHGFKEGFYHRDSSIHSCKY